MSKVETSANDECKDSTEVVKEKASRSGGILKHIILGSLVAVILGGVSKYCFFDRLRLTGVGLEDLSVRNNHIEYVGSEQVVEHEVSTLESFGEEQVELLPSENKVTLEQIPHEGSSEDQDDDPMLNYEEEVLDDEIDSYDEEESEDGENESQMDSETLKRMLKEDIHLELDEGFATKDDENEEKVDIVDDASIQEYEHEADDITDNNWSDDESELKRMEENQQKQ